MKIGCAAVSFGKGEMQIRDYPVLAPGPDNIVVRITMASICGPDLHTWRGEMPNLGSGAIVPGHEMAGIVESLGAN